MYEFLKSIITEAGNIALSHKARLAHVQVNRKSPKDLVTEADVAVENYLVAQIQQAYPDHAILGEESGAHAGGDYRWIIDPIDGTTSFVHDQPFFSNSVALEHNGDIILGAVNAPVLSELFMAEKGNGATLNDKPIHVSTRNKIGDCVLATGFACLRADFAVQQHALFRQDRTRRPRHPPLRLSRHRPVLWSPVADSTDSGNST